MAYLPRWGVHPGAGCRAVPKAHRAALRVLAGLGTASQTLAHQVVLADWQDLASASGGGSCSCQAEADQELMCSRVYQGAKHFTYSTIGVFFLCKRQRLGDPNELGAQQEAEWIKSSCLS